MNFTQSFEEFSAGLGPMDLALYAGVGIVIWVLFKDQLSPVQKALIDLFNSFKNKLSTEQPNKITISVPESVKSQPTDAQNLFFDLVVSWKQTRDLAEKSGCKKAVEVADTMFPYLSPTVCGDSEDAE
tara:strand:+ start:4478 stop:4861 length:384 start_codon:yes stop_codon:yes gene_type:complete